MSEMVEHTPGPWKANDDCTNAVTISCADGFIADVFDSSSDELSETVWANAHLIAAAPYLLAALKSCRCPGGGWNGMPKDTEPTVESCMAHAACGCSLGDAVKTAEPPS